MLQETPTHAGALAHACYCVFVGGLGGLAQDSTLAKLRVGPVRNVRHPWSPLLRPNCTACNAQPYWQLQSSAQIWNASSCCQPCNLAILQLGMQPCTQPSSRDIGRNLPMLIQAQGGGQRRMRYTLPKFLTGDPRARNSHPHRLG